MKTQIIKLLVIGALSFVANYIHAQHKFSMSSGTLEFKEIDNVSVEGYSGNEVIIETGSGYKVPERAKGLSPINGLGLKDNTGIGLAIKEESGKQVVYQVSRNSDASYIVKVPAKVNVKYTNSSIHGDDFKARNISSEMEIKSHGGDVRLEDVTGPLSVSTVHGSVDVIFNQIPQNLPSSIATVHGDLDVSIPENAKLDIRISTTWGEVYSNLDIEVANQGDMKRYSAKKVEGKMNGGGVSISVSSTHGNVYLRKK